MYIIDETTDALISAYLKVILSKTSEVTGVPIESIKGKFRDRRFVLARQLFCYAAFKYRPFVEVSKRRIGMSINRTHCTVIWSINQFQQFLDIKDKQVSEIYKTFYALNIELVKYSSFTATDYSLSFTSVSLIGAIKQKKYLTFNVLSEKYTEKIDIFTI